MENEKDPKETKTKVEEETTELLDTPTEEKSVEEPTAEVAESVSTETPDIEPTAEVVEPVPTETPVVEPSVEEPKPEVTEVQAQTTIEPKDEEPKQPNKTGVIIAVVAAIAAIGFIALFILPNFFLTGKKVVDKEITYLFTKARKSLKENKKNILQYDLDKESLGLEGTLVIESNYKGEGIDLSKLKDYELKYSGVIDKKANKASGTIDLVNKNKDLINVDAYGEGKDAYLALGDIYEKTIKTGLEKEIKDLDLSSNQNLEDIDKLLEKTEKIVKDTVKDKDIKKTKEEKEFFGKKTNYTKVEYTIKTQEFTKEVLEAYQKDDEIIELLANITQQTKKSVKESLEDTIANLKDSDNDATTKFNIYLKGLNNSAEAFELAGDDGVIAILKEKDLYKFNYTYNEKEAFNGEYNTKDKSFNIKNDEGLKIDGTLDPSELKININYKVENDSLKINAVSNNKVNGSTQDNYTTIKFEYSSSGEKLDATIYNKIKLEKNKKVDKIDIKDTINADDLSDEEMEKIETKLGEKLSQLINDIMPGLTDGTTDFRKLV